VLAAGHTRIGYLGDRRQIHSAVERPARPHRGARRGGRAHDPALLRMELEDSAMARRATEDLLDGENPPTAMFAARNLITVGAVEALRARRLQHAVALAGFDDLPLADAVDPGLTVVARDAHGVGRAAAEVLFGRLDGDGGPTPAVVLPTVLIAPGSGEIAA
jgi:LacI family transcriptional regulator